MRHTEEAYPYLISSRTDIVLAAQYGFSRLVEDLIPDSDPKTLHDALIESAKYGYLDCLKVLLNSGINFEITLRHGLKFAIFNGHLEVVKYLFEQAPNMNNLKLDMLARRLDVFKYILNLKAYINIPESVLLNRVRYRNDHEILRYLLNSYYWSNLEKALTRAVVLNNIEMVQILIQKGVPVNPDLLEKAPNPEMLEILIDHMDEI